MSTNKDNTAESQARAQVESIAEMVAALSVDYDRLEKLREDRESLDEEELRNWPCALELAELEESAGECTSEDDARERIQEDALSVEVRSGWANSKEEFEPEEFRIVLCTGGPHVELLGELGQYSQPSRVRVIYKYWGESGELFTFDHDAVLTYCQQFYFGE